MYDICFLGLLPPLMSEMHIKDCPTTILNGTPLLITIYWLHFACKL